MGGTFLKSKKIRKPTISKITGEKITKWKMDITIGKRTYKNASVYAAIHHIKNVNPDKSLLQEFKYFQAIKKKWKQKKLRSYNKAWRTRIKRKLEQLDYFAYDYFKSFNFENVGEAKNSYFELMGNEPFFDRGNSKWRTLWPWLVNKVFGGDGESAFREYEKWVSGII